MTGSGIPLATVNAGVLWEAVDVGPESFAAVGALREVFVYQRGTTTAVAVFSDQALTTPLSQPLVTDANGNVPGYVAAERQIDLVDVASGRRMQAEPLSIADLVGSDGRIGGVGSLGLSAVPPAIAVNSTPTGPPSPTGGWTCILAEGFHSAYPLGQSSSLFAPNRGNDGGLGMTADMGGFNVDEMQVFNPSQVLLKPDGVHLRAQSLSAPRASTSAGFLTGNATLTAATGTSPITSLAVTSLGGGSSAFGGLASAVQVTVIDPTFAHADTFTLSASAAGGATSLAVNSQTPSFNYPIGSFVWAGLYLSGCLSSQPVSPVGGEAGFPITGFTFLPASGISFAFEIVCSLPAADFPGGDMGWWATSGPGTNEIDFMEWTDYDANLSGVFDTITAWIDHVHSTNHGASLFSNSTSLLTAQTDGRLHRWTTEMRSSDSTVRTYLDGVQLASYSWLTGFQTGATDYLHLLLSHALRNAYSGKGPVFVGATDVVVRSVAVYQDAPHVGQNTTGGGIAAGTVLI